MNESAPQGEPLKPCPFCGSVDGPGIWMAHRVVCGGCDAEGPSLHDALLANVAGWNRRATPPIQQGVVEALAYWVPKSRPFSSETRDVVCIAHNNAWDRAHAALACLRATSGENGNG